MVTFRCKVAGDVPMLDAHAEQLLTLLGKGGQRKGILTAEELPEAIARLRRAGAADAGPHARAIAEREAENERESKDPSDAARLRHSVQAFR